MLGHDGYIPSLCRLCRFSSTLDFTQLSVVNMRILAFFVASILAVVALAQDDYVYTEPKSGIQFLGYNDKKTGFRYGFVLPQQATTDFIVQMVRLYSEARLY